MKKNKKIKKPCIIALVIGIAGFVAAQKYVGEAKLIDDTVSGTTYIGIHQTTENTTTVSTNSAKWYIKKIVTSATGTTISEAWSTNSVQPQWSNKWSERASTNTTYKAAQ